MPKTKTEYKTVDTNTLKGLKHAERLKANGWQIVRSGLFTIQFKRTTVKRTRRTQ
jgi:hypothetical protein